MAVVDKKKPIVINAANAEQFRTGSFPVARGSSALKLDREPKTVPIPSVGAGQETNLKISHMTRPTESRLNEEQWVALIGEAVAKGSEVNGYILKLTPDAAESIRKKFKQAQVDHSDIDGVPTDYILISDTGRKVAEVIDLAAGLKARARQMSTDYAEVSEQEDAQNGLKIYKGPEFESPEEVGRWIRRYGATEPDKDKLIYLPIELVSILKKERSGEDAGLELIRIDSKQGTEERTSIYLHSIRDEDLYDWKAEKDESKRPTFAYRYDPSQLQLDSMLAKARESKNIRDRVKGPWQRFIVKNYVGITIGLVSAATALYTFAKSDIAKSALKLLNSENAVVQPQDDLGPEVKLTKRD